jgi:hypothetical protein
MINEERVSLIRKTSNEKVVSNCFENVKFVKEDGFEFGSLRISSLESGHYVLKLKESNRSIPIKVHRGVYWETDSFILKEHSLVEQRENLNFIRLKNIQITKNESE